VTGCCGAGCDLPGEIMHDIRVIRDNPKAFDEGLARRWLEPRADSLIALDETRRAAILELQKAQERRNAASKEIGAAMAKKDAAAANDLRAEVAGLKATLPELEAAEREAGAALNEALAAIPNLPLAEVPLGKDENDNVEARRHGAPPKFPDGFKPKEHFEIGEALGLMDFDAAAKLSGARFVVLKGALARLERALEQFMLDLHTQEHGYEEINPPVLMRSPAMFGTAQLPKFREEQFAASAIKIIDFNKYVEQGPDVRQALIDLLTDYHKGGSDEEIRTALAKFPRAVSGREELERHFVEREFWLIPTAEVPMTN
jgi:seryl-tRNA synthetase